MSPGDVHYWEASPLGYLEAWSVTAVPIAGDEDPTQSATNSQEAERFLGNALRIADKQGANIFRLSAGIPLARMLAEGGRPEEAKSVLDHVNAIRLDEWDGPEPDIANQLRSDRLDAIATRYNLVAATNAVACRGALGWEWPKGSVRREAAVPALSSAKRKLSG